MFLLCPDSPQFQNFIAGSINHLSSNIQQRWSLFWSKHGAYERQILGELLLYGKIIVTTS